MSGFGRTVRDTRKLTRRLSLPLSVSLWVSYSPCLCLPLSLCGCASVGGGLLVLSIHHHLAHVMPSRIFRVMSVSVGGRSKPLRCVPMGRTSRHLGISRTRRLVGSPVLLSSPSLCRDVSCPRWGGPMGVRTLVRNPFGPFTRYRLTVPAPVPILITERKSAEGSQADARDPTHRTLRM